MKNILLLLTMFLIGAYSLKGQDINPGYDSTLARKLGADDYGMKTYVLVILKTGRNEIKDQAIRDSLFAGHFKNINKMANEGKLAVAGPLDKNANSYRGIFILNVSTFEEARELLRADPTIREGIFDTDLYSLYGSAALPVYLETHRKIEKHSIK
jgi:uncharacterized protein YciI